MKFFIGLLFLLLSACSDSKFSGSNTKKSADKGAAPNASDGTPLDSPSIIDCKGNSALECVAKVAAERAKDGSREIRVKNCMEDAAGSCRKLEGSQTANTCQQIKFEEINFSESGTYVTPGTHFNARVVLSCKEYERLKAAADGDAFSAIYAQVDGKRVIYNKDEFWKVEGEGENCKRVFSQLLLSPQDNDPETRLSQFFSVTLKSCGIYSCFGLFSEEALGLAENPPMCWESE